MEKKKKQLIIVRICCVLASFCLWLYISNWENPIKTIVIKDVPVELKNTDVLEQWKLAVSPGQSFKVALTIRGTDLQVMRAKAANFKVVADMSLYVVKKGGNNVPVQITKYPNGINVENTDNLYIGVDLDDFIQKTVTVKIKTQGKSKKGDYIIDESTIPQNAIVSGSAKYVSTVKKAVAVVNITNATKETSPSITYEAIDSDGKLVPNVEVKSIAQKTFLVNITPINLVNNLKATLETTSENITITGDSSVVNSIKEGDIKCTVNCNSILEGAHNLKVAVTLPQTVTNIDLSQETVKVNISKK